jgi:hypothetical protein
MADPQDRPDEGSGAIPPAPQKKAGPKKAPRKAPRKAPAKAAAKKAPTKAAKKAQPKVALKTPVSAAPPTPAHGARVTESPAALTSGDTARPSAAPPAQSAHSSGRTGIPVAIGLAAASLVAMVIRRLRRH